MYIASQSLMNQVLNLIRMQNDLMARQRALAERQDDVMISLLKYLAEKTNEEHRAEGAVSSKEDTNG